MREYKLLVSPGAILDAQNTYEYIISEYQDFLNAEKWLDDIQKAIGRLKIFPEGYSRLETEPWFSLGIRTYKVRKHQILFTVDNEHSTVRVLGIKYSRSDFSKLKL